MRLLTIYSLLVILTASCGGRQELSESSVFRFNISTGLSSLDPAFASNKSKWWVTNQIFNGLLEVNNDLTVVPCLAKSWEISDEGTTYRFLLQKDVFFHDSPAFANGKGRKLTAEDVAYSIRRILSTGTGAWILNDKLLKEGEEISQRAIVALNDSVVEIRLNQPCPFFLHILTMPYCYVVPKEAVDFYGEDFREHPVGTGAFVFSSWYEDNKLILAKNKKYWRSSNENELPKLDFVMISFIADANQEFRFFMNKKLDLVSTLDEGTRDELFLFDGSLDKEFSKKVSVQRSPYLITDYLGFQLDISSPCYEGEDHPFLDVYVRKALNAAIDKQALVNYYKSGLGFTGELGMVPRGIKGYESRVDSVQLKAVDYLKMSRFHKDIGSYDLQLQTSLRNKSVAEFLQKQWEQELGIYVTLDVCDGGTLNSLANTGKSKFFYAGWIADYPDPENFMALFYSPNFKPKGPNKMHYKNDVADSLFHAASIENENAARYDAYAKMDSVAMEDQAVIPLFHEECVWLHQNNVVDLTNNAIGLLNLERVSIKK